MIERLRIVDLDDFNDPNDSGRGNSDVQSAASTGTRINSISNMIKKYFLWETSERLPKKQEAVDNIVHKLRNFSIDRCHCFDPNEEFKLRQILHDIGIDRLEYHFKALARSINELSNL